MIRRVGGVLSWRGSGAKSFDARFLKCHVASILLRSTRYGIDSYLRSVATCFAELFST